MSDLVIEVVLMSSEESSSYPDDVDDDNSELELGLGLSLGRGVIKPKIKVCDKASSSSSSSVTKANINGACGTKRTAEPSSPPGRSQVVGWPPVRTYRMNSLASQAKSPPVTEDFFSTFDKSGSKNMTNEKGLQKKSLLVKVNMDGNLIGRKVDLNAHTCYKTLARALNDMFGSNVEDQVLGTGTKQSGRLLEGLSEFVITYEDKDGDWMLVGDVPWEMFLSSVRRLRIMKKTEANGLAPKIS